MEIKLKTWGNSRAIIITKTLMSILGADSHDEYLHLEIDGNKLILSKDADK